MKARIYSSIHLRALMVIVLACGISLNVSAQDKDAFGLLGANFGFGLHLPQGDYGDRFGMHTSVGSDIDFFTAQKSYIFGLKTRFFFGDRVNEDPIAFLRNERGLVASPGQANVSVFLRMRGLHLGAHVGKLFQLSEKHKLSNIRATLGLGLLQHKIRLLDESQSVALLLEDRERGMDRLTNGLAITQQIGYQRIDRNGFKHFYIGLELTQAFTQSRRDVDYQLQRKDDESRFDWSIGIRAAWTLPLLYTNPDKDVYYY